MLIHFAWLEITGRCQLECTHCYAGSGPTQSHGTMTTPQWLDLIDQLAELGCTDVQLIGGEPLLHPGFAQITGHALAKEMTVEVYSNLVHVRDEVWDLFASAKRRIRLATSYYGATAAEHATVTGSLGAHRTTRANIARAVAAGLDVRVGVIKVNDRQDVEAAVADIKSLGVVDVSVDDVRGVGRGRAAAGACGMGELCGQCGRNKVAILPDGSVTPCVIGRDYPAGNIHTTPLGTIVNSQAFAGIVTDIAQATGMITGPAEAKALHAHLAEGKCSPQHCLPDEPCAPKMPCHPNRDQCNPSCKPALPPRHGSVAGRAANFPCAPKPCNPDYACRPQQPCKPNRATTLLTIER